MTINSTTRKTNPFTGNGSAHTFPFQFKVFSDADIVVKKLEASTSIETTLTLGLNNDYIVDLNADQNSNPGGSITLKSGGNNQNLASGFSLVITSDVDALQGVDLTNQGGFFPEVINDALDKAIIIHQQQQTELDRSIRFSLTNTIGSLEITENAAARANKVLGFDNLGEFNVVQELGTYRGNWTAGRAYVVRDLVKDTSTNNIFFCNTAHTSSGAQPLTTNTNSANWDLIVDAATATTSSTNAASSATAAANSATAAANSATAAASSQTAAASSATTASTKATQADTAKTAAQTAQTAAETAKTAAETALDSFDDRYLGAKSSNPTLDNDGNALIDGALYFNTTVNRMRVYDLGNTTWLEVTISGSDLTNTNTVAGAISNVNAVGGNISNVNAVASNATNINAVNSNSSNINTVAGAASNINTVSGSIGNVNTVGGGIANVNTVAAEINNNKLQTVANNINAVVTAANDLNEATSEIDTVANNIANVNNVGNSISNVNTVAGAISNVNAVASNASNINTVGGAITNVNNVGGSIANVNTVANNLSGVNSFAERYRTDNTGNNPSTSLNAGDLFYNQASGKLLVYNGQTNAWEETQSVGNFFINTISSFSGTGGNSATFNGSAYKFTLSNAGQFAQQMLVSINGVVQKPNTGTGQPSEGFALDGANIIFSSPPPSGADFFIVTIGASVSIGTPSDNTVTSAKIVDGTIVNADINASAAIALTKLATSGTPNNTNFLRGDGAWTTVVTDLVNDSSPQLGGDLMSNSNDIIMADNDSIKLGNGTDFIMFHDASGHTFLQDQGNGALRIRSDSEVAIQKWDGSTNENMAKFMPDGAVELYFDNTKRFETTSNGGTLTGQLTVTSHLLMGDGDKIRLGDSQDLELHHSGGENYIQGHTNQLYIRSAQGVYIQPNTNENGIVALPNGAVELYHNNIKKFETTVDGVKLGDAVKLSFNDYSYIWDNNTNNNTYWMNPSNSTFIDIAGGNSKEFAVTANGTAEAMIKAIPNQQVELYYNGGKRLSTSNAGVTIDVNNNEGVLIQGATGTAETLHLRNTTSGGLNQIGFQTTDTDGMHHRAYIRSFKGSSDGTHAGSLQMVTRSKTLSGGGFLLEDGTNGAYFQYHVQPHTNAGWNLGSSSKRWHTLFYSSSLNSSDKNLKNTIQDSDLGLSFIDKLRPVSFKWNKTSETCLNDTKTHYGFIAQEVETALASENKTLDQFGGVYKPDNYKEDGTGDAMAISVQEILSPLVKAVQELNAKLKVLETKVATLEAA